MNQQQQQKRRITTDRNLSHGEGVYDDTKKNTHDSHIIRAKENLKLSHVGSSQRQASGTNQRMEALRQGRHCV